ncbi:MAG: VWA domain-containing protein [Candidatus Nanopelagicales bacterium]
MTRRALAMFLLSAMFVMLGGLPGRAAQAQSGGTNAVDNLRGCLDSGKSGEILLLLDQSASLQESDPRQARADAAAYLAQRLATFADQNDVELRLAVAGFDVDFAPVGGWRDVSDGDAAATIEDLRKAGTRQTGWETDYWSALEGARRYLAAEASQDSCQAIIWFTDGSFDLDVRDTADERADHGTTKPYLPGVKLTDKAAVEKAEAAGRKAICRDGGLADQLRESGVFLLAIGLQGDSSPSDFDFLASVATGARGDQTCGAISGAELGSFTLVSDLDDLIFSFDELGPDQGGSATRPVCRVSGCLEGRQSFVVDSAVRRVRILAGSKLPAARLEVRWPGAGEPVVIRDKSAGDAQRGSVGIAWKWVSDTAAEITLQPDELTDRQWAGVWSVTVVDEDAPTGAEARFNVHLEGDLAPALADADDIAWRVGGTVSNVRFRLVHRGTDKQVDPEDLTAATSLDAALELPDGSTRELTTNSPAAALAEPVSVDLAGVATGRARLRLRLDVTTAAAQSGGRTVPGSRLATQVVTRTIELLPPPDFPDVASTLDFGTLDGTTQATAELPITGAGCVWLAEVAVTTTPELAQPSVTSPANLAASCQQGAALPLSLTTADPDNGLVAGELTIMLAPADDAERAVSKVVRFSAEVRKPVDEVCRWWLAVLLTLIGVGLPIALLYATAWRQARIPASGLMVADLELEVQGNLPTGVGAISRRGEPTLYSRASDYAFVGISPPGQRALALPLGAVDLRATARNPLDPHVEILAPGRSVKTRFGGTWPLAVAGNWALLADQSGGLRLLVLVPGTADDQTRAAVLEDAGKHLPQLVSELDLPTGDLLNSQGNTWSDPGDGIVSGWVEDAGRSGPTAAGQKRWRRKAGKSEQAAPAAPVGEPPPGSPEDEW